MNTLDELKGPPTTKQISLWLERTAHSTSWLAQHLGMKNEDVLHCFKVGFQPEDLRNIAELMTHPRAILCE
ncbi:MAG: hypothetical protein JWO89_3377 [Verrucomicrobiaceae bacterium]|nr:hypothetical protein [Verrucomicrobiaceae bacterium]